MRKLILLLVCLSVASPLFCAEPSAWLLFVKALDQQAASPDKQTAANTAFADSGQAFSTMIKAGQGNVSELSFNASQAWHMAGALEKARAYSLIAELTNPGDAKIAAWYQKLRQDCGVAVTTEDLSTYGLIFWGREFWTVGGVLLLTIVLGGACAAWFFQKQGTWLRTLSIGLVTIFIIGFGFAWMGKIIDVWQPVVIVSHESSLRQGDSPGYAPIDPPVKAGSPARVLETRAGWSKLKLANGAEGWIQVQELSRLSDYLP